jgi:hypothetical protein
MRTRALKALTVAAVASAAGLLMAAPAYAGDVSGGGLHCHTWIGDSQGFGDCAGPSGNTTRWVLHVGCNFNPVVNTQTMYGPGMGSIGCWAFPGVNNVWITFP